MSLCIVNRLPMILCMSIAVVTETIDLWLDASDVLVTVFYQKDVHEHGVELHRVDAVPDVYKIPRPLLQALIVFTDEGYRLKEWLLSISDMMCHRFFALFETTEGIDRFTELILIQRNGQCLP